MSVHSLRRAILPIHRRFREHKLKLFFDRLNPSPSDTLLDVGGDVGMSEEFKEFHGFFADVTTLNLAVRDPARLQNFVRGDARDMPFPDKSFDRVFSNAVIEHVGTMEDMQRMAAEVCRVSSKGYFISTPNRLFPVDPHNYLPFKHYFSPSGSGWLLIGPVTLRRLFPAAEIVRLNLGSTLSLSGNHKNGRSLMDCAMLRSNCSHPAMVAANRWNQTPHCSLT